MRAAIALLLLALPLGSGADPQQTPVIAVVIDDLGNSLEEGKRVVALPGAVACSILPHTIDGPRIADLAHAAAKEVLLHLPMESVGEKPLGTGGITLEMTESEIRATVSDDLASVPHLSGMNNHEGSLITQHPGDMAWILQTLHAAGPYYYIDSYTTADSVAYQIAREQQVPAARRNVFLDDVNTEDAVREQWNRLLRLAKRDGFALAIGHPRPATLKVLEQELPSLAATNVMLVAPSKLVELQQRHPLPDVVTLPAPAAATALRN